ncbi:hypothetical protein PILCRDRAFT_810871 [Piloderma croceum F 1598]|uniref:Uncharacterized protein n=1 Tax=Piloderma croceum (strain F 1598) TaxID=765440 RepID=A0A0C3CPK8_PILCF|nr:hypothetical protein PILCRDRAFT_810871 [Piloderma croceum F 1598]
MSKCKLPQELIDIIIDYLPFGYGSCALVCRSWLPAAHRNLFHRVVLPPPNDFYYSRPDDVPYSKRLDQVLLKSPHISEYIRELEVYDSRDDNWIGTDPTLPRLLPKLTNLTRIKFRRLHQRNVPSGLKQSIYSVLELPSLTHVELEKATFANIDDLKDLLSHAKYSTNLSLNDVSVLSDEPLTHVGEDKGPAEAEVEEHGLHSRLQSNLVSLRLSLNHHHSAFLDWLIGPRSPWDVSHMHTLQVLSSYLDDTDVTNRLLKAIGNSLRHFHLLVPYILSNPSPYRSDTNSNTDFNFESNSGIKFHYLTDIIRTKSRQVTEPLPWLLRFLSNIGKFNQIEEIKLEVEIPDCDDGPVEWSDWEEVDCLLAGAHFESLRKLNILLLPRATSTREWLLDGRRNLVRNLPLLGARGILVNVR